MLGPQSFPLLTSVVMGPCFRSDDKLPAALPLTRNTRDIRRHRLADCRGRAGKTWRRGGLGDAVAADEYLSCRHVRMLGRLAHGQNRREADVGAFHDLAPL